MERTHHLLPNLCQPVWSRRCLVLTAVLLCSLGVRGRTRAATYYLNTATGSDTSLGTISAPWKTITKVQSSTVSGDSVIVQSADAGTYMTQWPIQISYRTRVVRQFEITWTFDKEYTVGQFANGDFWVIGPVAIIGIDPPSTPVSGRIMNGSMLNPDPKVIRQGYDNAMGNNEYDANLNVAYNCSSTNPLVLSPHSSLMSTISVASAGVIPQLDRAAVLTVLPAAPPSGSLRPAYCGTDKTIKFNKSQLDYSLLRSLPPVESTPPLSTLEGYVAAPWLDHQQGWVARYQHPRKNMPDYGVGMHSQIDNIALALHLNWTNAQKERLLVRFVQLGIDLYGIASNGGTWNWMGAGGHGGGRKWPILFAGMVLNDPAMKGIGAKSGDYLYQNGHGPGHCAPDYVHFGEDDQTFYVTQADVDATHSSQWHPDSRDTVRTPYETSDIGLPEWGIYHATDIYTANKWLSTMYRNVAGPALHGTALAALLTPGAKALWNHDAYFDYCDRWHTLPWDGSFPHYLSQDGFQSYMWWAYRKDCGPVWPETGASAPVLAPIGNQQVVVGETLTFQVSAMGGRGTLTYSASGLPAGATFSNQTFAWTPTSAQIGSYAVTFTVTDGRAQDSEVSTITVLQGNSAPVGATIGSKSVNEN